MANHSAHHARLPGAVAWLERLICAVLFLTPLVYVPGFLSYGAPRYFFFGTMALAIGLVSLWVVLRYPLNGGYGFNRWPWYALAAYLGVWAIAAIQGVDPYLSFFSSFQRTTGWFAFLLVSIFAFGTYVAAAWGGKRFLLRALSASVAGATVLAIFIHLSPDGLGLLAPSWLALSRGGGMLGNSSIAGVYLLWNLFFAAILWSYSRGTPRAPWTIAALVVILSSPVFLGYRTALAASSFSFELLVGQARAAVLGLVFGGAVAAASYLVLQKVGALRRVGVAVLICMAFGVAVGGYALLTPNSAVRQAFEERATATRFIFWNTAYEAFKERPLLGYGPETFARPFHEYFDPAILQDKNLGEGWVDKAHNIFMEHLAGGGLLATAALIFFLVAIVWGFVHAGRLGALGLGALAGWLLQAQFMFDSFDALVMLFFAAGIAFAFSLPARDVSAASHPVRGRGRDSIIMALAVAGAVACFVVVIALPYAKARMMSRTYSMPLPERAAQWKGIGGMSSMGNDHDTTIMFSDIYGSYVDEILDLKLARQEVRTAALAELDQIAEHLARLADNEPDNYPLALLTARFYYIHMELAGDFSGKHLEQARLFTGRSMKLSPTDLRASDLADRIETGSGQPR